MWMNVAAFEKSRTDDRLATAGVPTGGGQADGHDGMPTKALVPCATFMLPSP